MIIKNVVITKNVPAWLTWAPRMKWTRMVLFVIMELRDLASMRCWDSLRHMRRPGVIHKKHWHEVNCKFTKLLVDLPERVGMNYLIQAGQLDTVHCRVSGSIKLVHMRLQLEIHEKHEGANNVATNNLLGECRLDFGEGMRANHQPLRAIGIVFPTDI